MSTDQSFAPVYDPGARILILGSLPGKRSIAEQGYYAHPRNAFWPIMGRLLGIDYQQPYEARLLALKEYGVALWDVVGEAERPGSLDSAIVRQSVRYNPIPQLVAECPQLKLIVFNGGAAKELFRKAEKHWAESLSAVDKIRLPSTSPANAALSFDDKYRHWSKVLNSVLR